MVRAVVLAVTGLSALFSLLVEVEPQARLTNRVLFVLDVSGSMRGRCLEAAMRFVRGGLELPSDDLQVGILAFSDSTRRWEGVPEPDGARPVEPGWAALPSLDALSSAQAFLDGFNGAGGTLLAPALREALADPQDSLSVVLVTDGVFGDRLDQVVAAIEEGQAERERRGLARAVVVAYGVGGPSEALRAAGEVGGGGAYREVPDEAR